MPLAAGSQLGPYEIVAPLGAGGMGEVHRARDPRLGRDVAIKALPAAFATDPERLARFEREARLLASLNHPNVAGIHGLETADGHRYLVLELVEGETLAARLPRGALPVDEALAICRQVAAGVEAAHEAGIVHRDLKPGNVMLRPDGTVKVLDFGLAKSGGQERTDSDADLTASPTMTAAAATSAGMILGTAAYMSPEQARGRAVDKRSDIWSFGCVLYECLTGRSAFPGETVSDMIAAILKSEPDLATLPAATPTHVRALLARCLTKDPQQRLRDIGEARVALAATAAGEVGELAAPRAGLPLWAAAAAALGFAALAVAVTLLSRPASAPAPVRRLDLLASDIQMDWYSGPQISPDGRRIAYIAKDKLWIRDLQHVEARTVAEIGGLTPVAWSPDGRWVLYTDAGKLWRQSAETGERRGLCNVPGSGSLVGIEVSRSGRVALATWRGGIYEVSFEGGEPKLLFDIDPNLMIDFHEPTWLPNGDLLHVVHWRPGTRDSSTALQALWAFDGQRRVPVRDMPSDCSAPRWSSGRILFVRRGANAGLYVTRYDERARAAVGAPVLLEAGASWFSLSNEGSIVYLEGGEEAAPYQMLWTDRSGRVLETVGTPYPGLALPLLSPDGRRVAFSALKGGNRDVWVRDLVRGVDTRITFAPEREGLPVWLDDATLAYVEVSAWRSRMWATNADGTGGKRVISPDWFGGQEAHFAPGSSRALRVVEDRGRRFMRSAARLPEGGLGPPEEFLQVQPSPSIDDVALSRDGRLLAYATDDPAQAEVFMTRFPSGQGHWQVSREGGRRPRMAPGSRELFFIGGAGPSRRSIYSVPINDAEDPPVGTPTRLFDVDPRWLRFGDMSYDVTPDGQRFLMAREVASETARARRMILVQHWDAGGVASTR